MHLAEAARIVPLGLSQFLTVLTCLASLFFGLSYTIMRRWWRYQMGWNLFFLRTAIGFVLLPYTLHVLFGIGSQSAFSQWFSTIVFILVPLALLHITWMLYAPAVRALVKKPAIRRHLPRSGLVTDGPEPVGEDDLRQPP